jgi:hypothetical protein
MDINMWIALLCGGFALGGALVSGILALRGYRLKIRHELEKQFLAKHFERLLQVYGKAFEIAPTQYQTGSRVPSLEEVRTINKDLILVASPEVIGAFNREGKTGSDLCNQKSRHFLNHLSGQ